MPRNNVRRPRRSLQNSNKVRLPRLFARGGRDRILICLAVNGPMHVRHIGRSVRMDSHKTWNAVERLVESGIVVKRTRPGGRKYVSLNRQLPIYRSLKKMLLALDRHWPAIRIDRQTARWHMPFDKDMRAARLDQIFHSRPRSRMLTFIAASGVTDMQTMYKFLGIGSVSAMYIVNFWEREGVVRTNWFKRHRLVSLDPNFIVAKELKALLREIVIHSGEYRALRRVARARLRKILKAANANR
jgi:hypothetical protein